MAHLQNRLKQDDLARLRILLEPQVKETLALFLNAHRGSRGEESAEFVQRVLNSTLYHTDLMPSGDVFDIHIRVEVHAKEKVESPQEP